MQHYKGKQLYVEDVPVSEIAEGVGTPVYIYSRNQIVTNYREYQAAFQEIPHIICYAVKANPNLAVLKVLAQEGSGADIVSGGELFKAIQAGIRSSRIVFAGVGKREDEIIAAIRKRILMFNVESRQELTMMSRIAATENYRIPIALRVNPNIDPKTHPYIATGLRDQKFGVPIDEAFEHYKLAAKLPGLNIVGLHMHLGSQITTDAPFRAALQRLVNLFDRLAAARMPIRYVDIGGGLGLDYETQRARLTPVKLFATVRNVLAGRNVQLILEPGRSITANAGILVTKVLLTKCSQDKTFVVVDAGMNDMIRPSLYDAYHRIIPVRKNRRPMERVNIVGPVCESADFLGNNRDLRAVRSGELLALLQAGAYGFAMSSNYNSRLRPAEVMVDGKTFSIVRKRETYRDLVRLEKHS